MMANRLIGNDLRAACVQLSRLLDPREHSQGTPNEQGGQTIELAMQIVEETAVNIQRIADALERMAASQEAIAKDYALALTGKGG